MKNADAKKKYLFLIPLFTITGCFGNTSEKVMYIDNATINDSSISISFTKPNESKTFNASTYDISLSIKLCNTNPKPVEYVISSPMIVREKDKAEYNPSVFYAGDTTIRLECDIEKTYSFSSVLPSSTSTENYYFSFVGNGVKYRYCLYETPDELRPKITVNYMIDGKNVEAKKMPKGKKLSSYDWISSDYVYACREWFSDASRRTKLANDYVVNDDITLYGRKEVVLKYNTPTGINAAYITGYNFVPPSGEIVIPRSYDGKSTYGIMAGAFNDAATGLQKIFFPKISSISGTSNFTYCWDLKVIYFEGTENEWNSINKASFGASVQIVFNTYKD